MDKIKVTSLHLLQPAMKTAPSRDMINNTNKS